MIFSLKGLPGVIAEVTECSLFCYLSVATRVSGKFLVTRKLAFNYEADLFLLFYAAVVDYNITRGPEIIALLVFGVFLCGCPSYQDIFYHQKIARENLYRVVYSWGKII